MPNVRMFVGRSDVQPSMTDHLLTHDYHTCICFTSLMQLVVMTALQLGMPEIPYTWRKSSYSVTTHLMDNRMCLTSHCWENKL